MSEIYHDFQLEAADYKARFAKLLVVLDRMEWLSKSYPDTPVGDFKNELEVSLQNAKES